MGEYSERQVSNSLGLQFTNTGDVVTIASGLKSDRYRVQASDSVAMPLILQQLINRLREKSTESLTVNVNQNHFQIVVAQIDAHFAVRLKMKNLMVCFQYISVFLDKSCVDFNYNSLQREIKLLMAQLRNIEKKLLRSIREPTARSLTSSGLPLLLNHTHRDLLKHLDEYEAAQKVFIE